EELRSDLGHRGGQIAEPDALANGRAGASARADADLVSLAVAQRVSVARHPSADHLEADQLSRQRLLPNRVERLPADEVPLVEFGDPAEPRLERICGLVDVVAVEREARFEAERVARAEAGRLHPHRFAELEERAPKLRSVVPRAEDLDAVLARVSGARDGASHVRHHGVAEAKALELLQLGRLASC